MPEAMRAPTGDVKTLQRFLLKCVNGRTQALNSPP